MGGGGINESVVKLLFEISKFPHFQPIIQSTKPNFLRYF
jgi:hypothetical protein